MASCISAATSRCTVLEPRRSNALTVTSPKLVWERSSRAFSDCSGEGRPSNLNRTMLQGCPPRPSPGRGLWVPSDLSRASLGRGDLLAVTSPKLVWERSSRAFSDCSGEGRPSKFGRTMLQGCAVGPHPDEALRARPTSPVLRSGEVTC